MYVWVYLYHKTCNNNRKIRAEWKQDNIWYLGIEIASDLQQLEKINLESLVNNVEKRVLGSWDKLSLSWFGHMATIQMKILPQFLFLF